VLIPLSDDLPQDLRPSRGIASGKLSPVARAVAAYEADASAHRFAGAVVNAVFGFVVAWTPGALPNFRGRRHCWTPMVDLPFALPTAVSGIALTAVSTRATDGSDGCFAPYGIKARVFAVGRGESR
jgi:sulfate/thiosulfate transport system permease protein